MHKLIKIYNYYIYSFFNIFSTLLIDLEFYLGTYLYICDLYSNAYFIILQLTLDRILDSAVRHYSEYV